MKSGTAGKLSPNAKSYVPACFYRNFRPRGVSRPKFSKVDQSTPGFEPKYRKAPPNIWYREALGHANVAYLHHIKRFTVKTGCPQKSGRGTAVAFFSNKSYIFSSETVLPRAMR